MFENSFDYWCRDQDTLTPKLIPLVRRATVFRRVSPVFGSVIIFFTNAEKYICQQIQLMVSYLKKNIAILRSLLKKDNSPVPANIK